MATLWASQLPPKPSVRPKSSVRKSVKKMALPVEGSARVEPATQEETEFAARYKAAVRQCRKTFADKAFDLPTLPTSAVKVMQLMQDPEVSTRLLANTLLPDLALTAKFLRVANSAIYAGNKRVTDVKMAIDRLGMSTVRSIVLAISLNMTIIKEKRVGSLALDLWKHSSHVALAAQALAPRVQVPAPAAFTLGLMHDIGKLPALMMSGDLLKGFLGVRPDLVNSLIEDTHEELGGALAEIWGMSADIRLAISGHHKLANTIEAMAFINSGAPETPVDARGPLSQILGCVILADRSLAAMGLSKEPGDLRVGDSGFAADLGLSAGETMQYMGDLPKLLRENDLSNL